MAQAKRDENQVPTLLAVSNADGITPVVLYADPTTHRLLVSAVMGSLDDLSDVVITGGAQGDILYNNGTNWVNLGAGTTGKYLKTQGAGANPMWDSPSAAAAGSDTQVQFNDGGTALGGDAGFTYNKTTDSATLVGSLTVGVTLLPDANDGAAIGTGLLGFSDLFLASGAVISFDNGDVTITHGANVITVAGGDLALGANNLTMTGSLGATGAGKLTKVWSVDAEFTNLPTINGGTLIAALPAASTSAAGLVLAATAPAAGLYNYVGITNGETAYTNKALFDATDPTTQAFGDAAAVGTAAVAARRDHKHAMMAAPTSVTGNAGTVTVAAETADTSCSIAFVTDVSGSLPIKTNTNMTFNSNTGVATFASAVLTTADINGGTFDNATIGASTPSTIVGTTVQANTGFVPDADDGAYLGTTALGFSDLFLAAGGVINWANGQATITETSADVVTVGGADLKVSSPGNVSTSVLTTDGTQTITAKTLGAGATVIAGYFDLDSPASDHTAVGPCTNAILSGATVAAFELVFLGSGGKWLLVDADAVATCKGMIAMALEAKNDTQAMLVALPGAFVRDDTWAWTVGATLYAGETPGTMQEAIPTGADAIIKVVAFAVSADVVFFNPSPDQQSTVA